MRITSAFAVPAEFGSIETFVDQLGHCPVPAAKWGAEPSISLSLVRL